MRISEQIGARIKRLRKAAGLSQTEVALKAGVAASYFSALERGEKNATISTLTQVADALDVSFAELTAGELVEVEKLLADIPGRLRPGMIKVIREAVLVIRQAWNEPGMRSGRR